MEVDARGAVVVAVGALFWARCEEAAGRRARAVPRGAARCARADAGASALRGGSDAAALDPAREIGASPGAGWLGGCALGTGLGAEMAALGARARVPRLSGSGGVDD